MNSTALRATFGQCKAELLRTVRNRRFVIFSVIMPVIFYFIFTNTVPSDTKVGNVDWSSYYLMSMTVYGIVGASLTSFAQRLSKERTQGWLSLLRITPLPTWSYVTSKVMAQGLINLTIVLIMFMVGGFVKHVDMSASQWLTSGLFIWLGGFTFMGIGTLIGSIKNADFVQVLSMICYMGLSMLGGLWFPVESMSDTMQKIAHATPTYRLGQGAWDAVAGASVDWNGVLILIGYVAVFLALSSYIMKKQEAI
ncbi:ABC transporter permease [Cohnella yongneupensis]|uniref:ABC transporter permease n=1 Tax=Cohnella yongneupensis TaxID=425006 RepID=A0ABW0R134_9BACL